MRKSIFLRLASIFSLMSFMVASAHGQAVHTLQGRVILSNGDPPPIPVRVALTFNGVPVNETFTDLSGRFSFGGLSKGVYQLTAYGDGETFDTTNTYAEIAAFGNAPRIFSQNVQLRPKRGKPVSHASIVSLEELDPAVPPPARNAYRNGVKNAIDDKPEQAIKQFQQAILIHPPFYAAHAAMADQQAKLKRFDEAVVTYQRAIQITPDRAEAQVGLGVVLVKQQKYGEAIAPLRRSLEIEKQSSTAYLFLGLAEMMTGDYQSSESHLLRAYEIAKPMLAHIYLANLYELKGEATKAIEHLQAFLKENPNLPRERQSEIRGAIDKLRKQTSNKPGPPKSNQ